MPISCFNVGTQLDKNSQRCCISFKHGLVKRRMAPRIDRVDVNTSDVDQRTQKPLNIDVVRSMPYHTVTHRTHLPVTQISQRKVSSNECLDHSRTSRSMHKIDHVSARQIVQRCTGIEQ